MSFLNIKDPEERYVVIEDYLALKKRLMERNLEERGYHMDRQRDLQEIFETVVASNREMAQDSIKDLRPINEGLQEINGNIKMKKPQGPKIGSQRRLVSDYGPLAETLLREYMDDPVDKTFDIRYENGQFMIGDKVIKIRVDNVEISGETYEGTSGMWSLITERNPKEYSLEDYERYNKLLYETNVLYRDYESRRVEPRV